MEQQDSARSRVQTYFRGESRAQAQHDVLVRSLEKVAEEAEGENKGWTIKLIIFVGGTCGSVHTQTFNNNLKELGVVESKRNSIRKGVLVNSGVLHSRLSHLQISKNLKKISDETRRNLLQPQTGKNLLRKWSRFCKNIL